MYSEYEEIERFLDEAAESYVPLEDRLSERGIDYETAMIAADKFRKRFYDILHKKGIGMNNISRLCYDLTELLKHDRDEDSLFLYTAMLSEVSLLFGKIENDEQKIELWLDQSEKVYYLKRLIKTEQINSNLIREIIKGINSNVSGEIDPEEHEILYDSLLQYDLFYKRKGNPVFYENIGELIRQVNVNEKLKTIKPYVYTAVLSRKHKKITEQKGYMPNIRNVFTKKQYQIQGNTAYIEKISDSKEKHPTNKPSVIEISCF